MLVVSQGHSISRLLWWEGFVLWHKPPRKSPNREEPPRLAGRATASGHTSPVGGHAGEGVLYSTVRLRQSIGYLRAPPSPEMAVCARMHPAKSLVGSADQRTAPARALFSGPSHPVPLPRLAARAIPTHIRRGNRPRPRRLPDGIVQTRPPVSPFVDARHRPRVRLSPRRTPEGVSTTWTPHTKTPLPCSVVAGPKGPLLLGPHSHATALLPLERTGAKPVALVRAAFRSPRRPCGAPVTTPAAAALPVLVSSFTSKVASLAGVTRRAARRMSASPEAA